MKIGIHHSNGSFSDRWIAYCDRNKVAYKLVDCYQNDIISQLADCDALMWHFHHASRKDYLFAKELIYALQLTKKTFPDFPSMWHFDDKVGQKYLLEALNLPLVPSYVFYSEEDAVAWAKNVDFPKVFKLRGGAGSVNVKLVKGYREARQLIRQAFGKGFKHDSLVPFGDLLQKYRRSDVSFSALLKGFVRQFVSSDFAKVHGRERGYVYFQDYVPRNSFDIRVIVIDKKAFAIKRMTRQNDFRASGSGLIRYERKEFDVAVIRMSLKLAVTLRSQCLALDFVQRNGEWLIVEISYGFAPKGYDQCVGYWDENLNFVEGPFDPYGWMVDLVRLTSHD